MKGPKGLFRSHRRNIGALAALNEGAELLAFLDVDCIPGRSLLGRYYEAGVDLEHRDALLCGPVTYLPPPRGAEGYLNGSGINDQPAPGAAGAP